MKINETHFGSASRFCDQFWYFGSQLSNLVGVRLSTLPRLVLVGSLSLDSTAEYSYCFCVRNCGRCNTQEARTKRSDVLPDVFFFRCALRDFRAWWNEWSRCPSVLVSLSRYRR